MPITVEQGQQLIREFCRVYPTAYQLSYMVRATQEEIFNETATIERAGRIFGAYFSTGRLAAFATSNSRDANDFIQTIRHEILGHFGLNTFRSSEKRAIINAISETRKQPTLCGLWSDVDACIPVSRNHSKLGRSFVLHVKQSSQIQPSISSMYNAFFTRSSLHVRSP